MIGRRVRDRLHALATYDFSPRFSARARRFLYNPLGVLVLAGASALLCGFFLHAQGFVLAGGVGAVVALGVAWPLLALRALAGTVTFDRDRVEEGEAVGARLTLRNRLPVSAWGLAVRGGFGGDPAQPEVCVSSAPPRRTIVCKWAFTPSRRGVYPLAAPRVATGFPFGLWETSRPLAVELRLVVWPKTFPVGPIPPVGDDRQVEGNVSRARVGTTGDVLGVRPYRQGDSPRRIHWAQSAKHDRLIVCELQSNSRPVIQLVLDADPRVHTSTGVDSSREWAVRIAASLAKGWLEAGAQVGLAWAGLDLPPASGLEQVRAVLDALAAFPDTVEKPLADVLTCPVCRGFRDGLQVIVATDRSHGPAGCKTCASENQRWVVLASAGFGTRNADRTSDTAEGSARSVSRTPHSALPRPWLAVNSADDVPALLLGGWREARHGS